MNEHIPKRFLIKFLPKLVEKGLELKVVEEFKGTYIRDGRFSTNPENLIKFSDFYLFQKLESEQEISHLNEKYDLGLIKHLDHHTQLYFKTEKISYLRLCKQFLSYYDVQRGRKVRNTSKLDKITTGWNLYYVKGHPSHEKLNKKGNKGLNFPELEKLIKELI